ncbi:MAG: radical SAM protein [Phycisphaerae bacterium]|nr:radical SAM protein [Phycisphaerae bacterium]
MADRDLGILGSSPEYDSRTETAAHTTAFKLNKHYRRNGAVSNCTDKSAARADDGHVTSHDYAAKSSYLQQSGNNQRFLDVDFQHPLENWLGRDFVRRLLSYVSRNRPGRKTIIEEVLSSYGDPKAPLEQRIKYWPLHKFIDWMRGSASVQTFRKRVSEHTSTVRGLVTTARSVAEFGLTVPQRFSAPLFSVWNFTNRCNLRCRHCYQDSAHQALADELTLTEKLDLVDQIAAEYVPMVAFAGGEPTICPDLLPVLRHCQKYGMHMSLATHGATMTPRLAGELAGAGVRYVEISLDSVHPEKHDAFRGLPGMWHRTVRGMRHVVEQEGLRLGIAMCVHRENIDEVEDMLQFAVDIGAGCFAHFNFIPVGRGLEMAAADITPRQRQWLLETLNKWMQSGRIGVISTAPQLGRVCLAEAPAEGRQSCSHAGSGGGWKARVVAKYLGGCGAGRTYVCIEPNGDITPCVYMPQRVLGNIRRRRFRDIFRDNEFWELLCDRARLTHHCEVCRFKNYCGGCRARADSYYGAVNAGDPGCIFNEKHWEALVQQGLAAETAPASEPQPAAVKAYDGCTTTWNAGS